ncbi:MAG: hypothetical protein PHN59_01870 [Candidatus Omnitrophica bacterium]|nr:hypothetical protein [Candidatus Omnitrophota bacterium]
MKRLVYNQKGVAMVMALSMVILAIILANVVMNIMLSHGRLTRHQVGRIEAYYAGLAGVNLAIDSIMRGHDGWDVGNSTHNLCNPASAACLTRPNRIDELSFAPAMGSAIEWVEITVRELANPEGGIRAGSRRITATVTYQNPSPTP